MEVVRYWHYGSSSAISGPAKQHQPLSAKVAGSGGAARPNWFFDIILEQSQRQLQAEATHGPCGSGSSSSNNNNNKNNSHYINRCSSKNDESQNSSNGGSKSSVLPDLLLPFPCHCADCMAMFPTALGRTVPAEALSKTASPPRNKPGRPKGSLTKRKTDELPPRSEVETPTKMSVAVLDRATNTFSQKLYGEFPTFSGTNFYYLLESAAWLPFLSPSLPLLSLCFYFSASASPPHLRPIISKGRIPATSLTKPSAVVRRYYLSTTIPGAAAAHERWRRLPAHAGQRRVRR